MSYFDWVVLLILFLSSLGGWLSGIASALKQMFAWGCALWLAIYFAPQAAAVLHDFGLQGDLALLIVVLGGFIAWLILLLPTLRLLSLLVSRSGGGRHRTSGLLLGLLSGLWSSLVLVFLFGFIPLQESPVWQESYARKILGPAATRLWSLLPGELYGTHGSWSLDPGSSEFT